MTTTVDQKHRVVIPFEPGDVLEIEQRNPNVVVLKRTRTNAGSARNSKARSNKRLKNLCAALQRERNPAKVRKIKSKLVDEFYNGDKAP